MTNPRRKPGRIRVNGADPVRTLERGLLVLQALGEHQALSLSEIARQTALSPSTASRLLQTLHQQGFADWQEDAGLWRVGLRAFQVGVAYLERNGVIGAANPEMEALVAELNETINLAVLQDAEAVYVHQVEGRQLVRMFTHIGARASLHCTGVGKVLMAWRPEAEVRQKLGEGPFPALTPHTLTTLSAYLADLALVRQLGYALDNEERELGVRCIATPIHDQGGQVVASLSLSVPAARMPNERLSPLADCLKRAGSAVSQRLGWEAAGTRPPVALR